MEGTGGGEETILLKGDWANTPVGFGCTGCIVVFWNGGRAPYVPNDPPNIPVGCESSGPDVGNPVGCDKSGCDVPGKPVGCADRYGGGAWPWKGDALNGRVGTKLLNPVVVGIRGCNRL